MKRTLTAAGILTLSVITGLILHAQTVPATRPAATAEATKLPPNEMGPQGNGPVSKARVEKSPRHGEWVEIKVPGAEKPLKTWVVYPERPDKAPVVLVIMEIYGMSDWMRATTDQLAADGFIAVAPDFMSKTTSANVSALPADQVIIDLNAAREYALAIPSANGKVGAVGFCWGGGFVNRLAVAAGDKLDAGVVYYGPAPNPSEALKVTAPLTIHLAGLDARVAATAWPWITALRAAAKPVTYFNYDGANHAFNNDTSAERYDKPAADLAWKRTLRFFGRHLA